MISRVLMVLTTISWTNWRIWWEQLPSLLRLSYPSNIGALANPHTSAECWDCSDLQCWAHSYGKSVENSPWESSLRIPIWLKVHDIGIPNSHCTQIWYTQQTPCHARRVKVNRWILQRIVVFQSTEYTYSMCEGITKLVEIDWDNIKH